MNTPLPGPLDANPELDRWVGFPAPGKVTVLTGRVELGQGVLTAMAQIAADELDVAIERITIRSGDTEKAPNEGYTAGSQSIQFGGVAMRQACADVRALFLGQAAKVLGCKANDLSIRVPPGIKLVRVDLKSGTRAGPGTERAILEAFKPGTAPPDNYSVMGSGDGADGGGRSWGIGVSPDADRAVRSGTGGLY
jgi:CO/xanthine dehydrogenase Mo-binding subunit